VFLIQVQFRLILEKVLSTFDRPDLPTAGLADDPLGERDEIRAPSRSAGSSTRTFFALLGPTLSMPTLLYFAGVPGAAKPSIQFTCKVIVDEADGVEAELVPPERNRTRLIPINAIGKRFRIELIMGRFLALARLGRYLARYQHQVGHDAGKANS